jgi:protein-disulfide isomerase
MIVKINLGIIGLRIVFFALLFAAGSATAQAPQATKTVTPAAKVGEEIISLEEVSRALQGELAQIERQRYKVMNQKLRQLIEERLLLQEAKRRGISTEQLLKEEIYAKSPKIEEIEVSDFIKKHQARLPQTDEFELRLKVWDYLRSQKIDQQLQAYVQRLREQAKVTVFLEEPASTRVQVNSQRAFTRGPKDAPVTIIEFSDFQCPFCKALLPVMNELMGKYPGKLQWVFMDFPIPSLHPTAPKAHEAARCAGEQGKFWEYHDLLFDRAPRHSDEELKQYAREIKLTSATFSECLASGKYQADVARDVEEGTRLGVAGTPSLFINGRLLDGGNPMSELPTLIERELAGNRER